MLEKKKDVIYPIVYRLMKLMTTLLIVTRSAKKTFSAMNIVKNKLHSKMRD